MSESELRRVGEAPEPDRQELAREFARAANRVSAENGSNTPDWILGEFGAAVVAAWDQAVRKRDGWYGVTLAPGMAAARVRPASGAVFLVVIDDMQSGVTVWAFATQETAHAAAWDWAREQVTDLSDVREQVPGPGQLLLLKYSDDGDSVWVIEETIEDQPVQTL